jgi:hypothetical protein
MIKNLPPTGSLTTLPAPPAATRDVVLAAALAVGVRLCCPSDGGRLAAPA